MIKIMIVDDDINVGQCLGQLIPWVELGFDLCAVALNGESGFDMAIEHSPDVIISDIVMPVMDGTALCRRIHDTMSDVTFIFLSAYEDFSTAQLALQYHVRDYILKPIDRNKINYLIKILTEIRDQREKNSFYHQLLHSREMEAEIYRRLEAGDVAYFERLFQRMSADAVSEGRDLGSIRDAAYRLVNLLYNHLSQILAAAEIEAQRNAVFKELDQLKFKMDLIFFLSELYFGQLRPSAVDETAYYRSLADRICEYIDQQYTDPSLAVSSVASHFNYSTDYLGRLFVRFCGDTASNYIAQKRIDRAAFLLVSSSLSISDITLASGYLSASYFARAFKKRFSLTPSEYRARFAAKRRISR